MSSNTTGGPTGQAGHSWLLLDSGPGDYAWNMALDEALLEAAPVTGSPVLRFYGWTGPAASIGYSQHIADMECATALRPLVRRPTGGGLVPHDRDWTYSVAVPPGHAWYRLRAAASYQAIHRWIADAFAALGIPAELAPSARHELPGQCFAGHEENDVLWFGRKVAGAAQRRTRSGLLIQGSLQPPPVGLDRNQWQQAMVEVARANSGMVFEPGPVPTPVAKRATELRANKYSQDSWNRKR